MTSFSIPLVLVALFCFVGRSGHMVGADQMLITDHIIVSVQQAPAPLPKQMDALPANVDWQQPIDFADMMTTELHRSLRFEPAKLDFGAWSIGTARSHTVTLVNQNENRSVYLSSVSGKTPAFYSSFFEAKVVPPQGNTTFNVVFLPRTNGAVATSLLIHTSFGQAQLLVRGEGRECPYRLKPILGIKAPLNATLTPEIFMYNPHEHPLQILEVYSSGGQFQLELPSGVQEGPQTLWEIPPFATKPVIRIRFNGNQAGNYTAYIRIKIAEHANESLHANENVLVIPVEFEILPSEGIYAENPLIDFKRLTTRDKVKQQKIHLKNSYHSIDRKPQDVVDFVLRDLPGLTFNIKDATVVLDPQQFLENTLIEELLVIKASSNRNASHTQEFSLLIRAEVFKGSLMFDKNVTVFVTKSEHYLPNKMRTLEVSNLFTIPLSILNVTMEHNSSNVFRLTVNTTAMVETMQPGSSMELLKLQLLDESARFRTMLRIHTNVTTISVPVVVCEGTLHVQTFSASFHVFSLSVYNTHLNLGIVPFAEMSNAGYIVLHNRNPLGIKLVSWDFQTPQGVHFHTTFIGCLRGTELKAFKANGTMIFDSSKFKFCTNLGENDVAAYKIAIKSYTTEDHMGSLKIWTAYELITAQVSFKTWIGKLEVDQEHLYFKNCFPGKLCSSDLSIRSTFLKPIRINSINFTDVGLTFKDFDADGTWIAPEATTKVGRIYFEPAKLCERCYIPQDNGKSNDIAFSSGKHTKGGNNNHLFDETELRRRTELFRHLKWYFQTISFTLNSNEIRQFQLYLIIDIEWPKLVTGRQTLPTIEVGKHQTVQVVIKNPANHAILVDYFLSDSKFSKDTQLSLPLEVVDVCTNCYLTDKYMFVLPDGAPKKPLLLPASSSVSVNVQFSADEAETYSTLLHIRNNLTLYEAVWLTAKTVQSQFKFGNRKPGSSTPLLFEVNEKHLSACTSNISNQENSNLEQLAVITKRTFTARNSGEIPIWIDAFLIGDQLCEGFGFKVVDCSSFILQANCSKKIEIAFSPDFTSARVSRPLTIVTNLSYDVTYALVAIMPPLSLDLCSELLPRPHWELRYKIATLVVVGTSFVLVMLAAHIDYANLLIKQTVLFLARDKGPVQPTFNLRNIAMKSQAQNPIDQQQATQSVQKLGNKPQNKSNGNSCNVRKRVVKKTNSNGINGTGRNLSLSDISWPLELPVLKVDKTEKCSKSMQTFSERNFKLKMETDANTGGQSPSNSSSSISSSESSATKTPPKTVEMRTDKDVENSIINGSKKQKNLKKAKKTVVQPTPSENNEKDLLQKTGNRSPKQVLKSSNDMPASNGKKIMTDNMKTNEQVLDAITGAASKQYIANSNDLNANGRKYGKTPGRERKRDSSNATTDGNNSFGSKRSDRKQRNKAANALNFNSSPINASDFSEISSFPSISSPWDTSSQVVSFSHVLQSQQKPPTNEPNTIPGAFEMELKSQLTASKELPFSADAIMKNDLNPYNKVDNLNTAELGPIGSKKSPSSTPAIWDPLPGTSASLPTVPKPTLSNNSSFFSNLLPSYGYNDHSDQFMGLPPSGLYELKKAQEELQRQWQANEYIFNLRQQQMLTQQQLQSIEATNNWAIASQTWTPMGYGQNSSHCDIANTVNAAIALSPWQRPTAMRPPPGLEQNFQSSTMPAVHHQQTQVAAETDPNSGIASTVDEMQSVQTFDPFSSLSSIWSENWNKNNHNDMK